MGAKVSAECKQAVKLHLEKGLNISQAAKLAGIQRSTLYEALKRAGISTHRAEKK